MVQKPRGAHKGSVRHQQNARSLKRKREIEDVDTLAQRVADLEVHPATLPEDFSELPLSQATQSGLEASHFKKLTAIQANGIPASLKGRDVLGAAKTGSGKTLAFIIPVLENLFRRRWTEYDGLGALVLSPTRELAIQIFDVLRKVGRNHTFSAGLVIGGKSLQEERERLGKMNILVATPGRILQHLDQTSDLDIGNLQVLVLDEADRIMDLGFKDTVDAIVDHLPRERQTLMFSATQTKKVSDLARLSLNEPEFVSVHETAETATPATLQQNYVVTPLPEKLDTLWSFLRANVKKKTLVFLSSGKQVRFVYESFRHLQPGVSLLHLHGRQKQTARLDITTKFSNSQYACLFATDVAARGLDFPAVDWVVQVDCPEDADTYIHRVGRTARYERDGRAVMFVDPSEEVGMLAALEKRKVTLERINVKQQKLQNTIRNQLQNMCLKDPALKYLGQKAFVSYTRSVHVQKDKSVFKVKELDLEEFAASMGLPGAPRVKFVKGDDAKMRKNMPRALLAAMQDSDDEDGDGDGDGDDDDEGIDIDNNTAAQKENEKPKPTVRTKYDRMFERRNQDILSNHYTKLIEDSDDHQTGDDKSDADSDDNFLSVNRVLPVGEDENDDDDDDDDDDKEVDTSPPKESHSPVDSSATDTSDVESAPPHPTSFKRNPTAKPQQKPSIKLSSNPDEQPLVIDSKRREKLLTSKKKLLKYRGAGSHVVFDPDDSEDNQGSAKVHFKGEDTFVKDNDAAAQREQFVAREREKGAQQDLVDKQVDRQRRREKKEKRKEKARMAAEAELEAGLGGGGDDDDDDAGGDAGVQLVPYEEDEQESKSKKKEKKWFEDVSDRDDDEDRNSSQRKEAKRSKLGRRGDEDEQPQTLEDLEAMAANLLAG